ncbi:hypothetical protein EG68_10633 [Paragonimus skrjabini miyazakii]|uniref:TIP41-like protein n=1 Tax=Paragonimus skrjabini miyazakii TaxID=59628 RepID=A0A8S9YS14_9TREM|nr:hypothetical protein EG68_10633 [Paragonimus skrjabini miyazakii]
MEDHVAIRCTDPKISEYYMDDWHISVTEHHILKSRGIERENFEHQLRLPNVPEMIFDKNCISVTFHGTHQLASGIHFTALDALKLVDAEHITLEVCLCIVPPSRSIYLFKYFQVPIANNWRQARIGAEEQVDHPKPYDWTFTTPYTGTLTGSWSVQPHKEGLDLTLLQRRDPILFYAETMLFEDELGDNGVAMLSVRFRAMATGFFLLQRFFLRVDGGLVRVYDTRLQWRKGDDYLIRDIRQAESSSWQPSMVGICLMEADRVCDKLLEHRCETLVPTA